MWPPPTRSCAVRRRWTRRTTRRGQWPYRRANRHRRNRVCSEWANLHRHHSPQPTSRAAILSLRRNHQPAGDIGNPIARGQVLAQLDGDLQTTNLNQAQAELFARRAETAQAEVSIADAQTAVVQAQSTLDQARIDADRLRQLANQGAISQQEAEAAELAAVNAQQAVRSAQAQVAAQQQATASAANQIDAQQAVLAQTQKQLSYADCDRPSAA